jgi:hypothetical protein
MNRAKNEEKLLDRMKASDLDEEDKTGSEDCEELPPYPPPYEQ